MKQLRKGRGDDSAELFLKSCELLCQVKHNPFLVCLIKVGLILIRYLVDMLDVVKSGRAQINFADAFAEFLELQLKEIINFSFEEINFYSYSVNIFTFVSYRHFNKRFDLNSD